MIYRTHLRLSVDKNIDVKILLEVDNFLDLFLDGLDVILFRDSIVKERFQLAS